MVKKKNFQISAKTNLVLNLPNLFTERMELVFQLVFKTNNRRITPAVAGSIPALSAFS